MLCESTSKLVAIIDDAKRVKTVGARVFEVYKKYKQYRGLIKWLSATVNVCTYVRMYVYMLFETRTLLDCFRIGWETGDKKGT